MDVDLAQLNHESDLAAEELMKAMQSFKAAVDKVISFCSISESKSKFTDRNSPENNSTVNKDDTPERSIEEIKCVEKPVKRNEKRVEHVIRSEKLVEELLQEETPTETTLTTATTTATVTTAVTINTAATVNKAITATREPITSTATKKRAAESGTLVKSKRKKAIPITVPNNNKKDTDRNTNKSTLSASTMTNTCNTNAVPAPIAISNNVEYQ